MLYDSINQQKSEGILWVVIFSSGIWFGFVEFVSFWVLMQKVLCSYKQKGLWEVLAFQALNCEIS